MTRTRPRRSLTSVELQELFDHLAELLHVQPCDGTLRKTAGFLADRGVDVSAMTVWLNRRGGYCDCEVLLNVERRV